MSQVPSAPSLALWHLLRHSTADPQRWKLIATVDANGEASALRHNNKATHAFRPQDLRHSEGETGGQANNA